MPRPVPETPPAIAVARDALLALVESPQANDKDRLAALDTYVDTWHSQETRTLAGSFFRGGVFDFDAESPVCYLAMDDAASVLAWLFPPADDSDAPVDPVALRLEGDAFGLGWSLHTPCASATISSGHSNAGQWYRNVYPIHVAAYAGADAVLDFLTMEGSAVDLHVMSDGGTTALLWGAVGGRLEVVERFEALGLDVHQVTSNFDNSPLHLASINGTPEFFDALVAKGLDPNARNREDMTPLLWAAYGANAELFDHIAEKYGSFIGVRNRHGHGPVLCATFSSSVAMVRHLAEKHGVAVNEERDVMDAGLTHWAARSGSIDLVRAAVEEFGADPGRLDYQRRNVLHAAAMSGNVDLVRWLVAELGMDPGQTTRMQESAAMWAARCGRAEVFDVFVSEFGNDPAHFDSSHRTAAHLVCMGGRVSFLRHLLRRYGDCLDPSGARLDAIPPDNRGFGGVEWAAFLGNTEIIDFFAVRDGIDLVPPTDDAKGSIKAIATDNGNPEIADRIDQHNVAAWWLAIDLVAGIGTVIKPHDRT